MNLSRFLSIFVTGTLALYLSSAATAQEQVKVSKIDIDKVEIDTQKTPEFNLSSGGLKKAPRSREWLEIDVKFEIEGRSTSNDYLDQVSFKYYIVLDDKAKTMITATVDHVNVPMNEEVWSSVYIAPSTIEKMMGKGNVSRSTVAGWAIEILHNGEVKGGDASKDKSSKWWRSRQGTAGALLSKANTPFRYLWWDRYAEEKPAGN